jgi:hypothetical protein
MKLKVTKFQGREKKPQTTGKNHTMGKKVKTVSRRAKTLY